MLILLFGGAGQGPDDYARSLFPGKELSICKAVEAAGNLPVRAEILLVSAWEDYVRIFSDKTEEEMLEAAERLLSNLLDRAETLILSMNECGCGIVPLGAEERRQRERCGILLQWLAARAVRVDRVMGGLGICLKGGQTE